MTGSRASRRIDAGTSAYNRAASGYKPVLACGQWVRVVILGAVVQPWKLLGTNFCVYKFCIQGQMDPCMSRFVSQKSGTLTLGDGEFDKS